MNINFLSGINISNNIINNIINELNILYKLNNKYKIKPTLSIIIIGNNLSSDIYIKNKVNKAIYIGYKIKIYKLHKDIKENKILNLIYNLNKNKKIHAIIVQLPIPKNINSYKILSSIDINKDVDCLNPFNVSKLIYNNSIFKPCTSSAIMKLLKVYKINIKKLNTIIIGKSNIVGKPLFIEFINRNYPVTIINSNYKNIINIIKRYDLIIVAAGKTNFISTKYIKNNAIIIDIGINIINGKIRGDVNIDFNINKTLYISPVPGGIGPITVSVLLENVLKAYKLNNN